MPLHMTFPVLVVPDDAGDLIEQLGTKLKFWYFDPVRGACLYKQGRRGTGEDWAERVACEVAEALGLPHATYDLAIWRGQQGVVTPSFRPADGRLVFGNELLVRAPVADHELDRGYLRQHHTIPRVFRLLSAVNLRIPQPWPVDPGGLSAGEVFVGYLLLDALIGNQDRHDENWGIVATNSELRLQPTFDHASSLGRNETDDRRLERLNSKDELRSVAHYCKKAKSWLFAGVGQASRLTTLHAFLAAAQLHTAAAIYWLGKLDSLPEEFFRNTLDRVPDDWISTAAREFAIAMMLSNCARLLGIKL
jgi:hypothetical protein